MRVTNERPVDLAGPPATAGRAARSAVAVLVAVLAGGLTVPGPATGAPVPTPHPTQWYLTETWQVETSVWPHSQGEGVTVAVIDTGVDDGRDLPEMRGGVVLPGVDLARSQPGSDGRWDFDGHGTQMGMLIAARGVEGGMAGVAPRATILPVKTLTGNETRDGIRWAADNGATVINISKAGVRIGATCSPSMQAAIDYAIDRNVVIVASAGNDGHDTNLNEAPSGCPGVLAVGAVDRVGNPWHQTQRKPYVAVAAPGVELPTRNKYGEPVRSSGTSNSAALMSGVVALVRAKFPDLSAREVIQRVVASARDVGPPGRDDTTGYGLVDPARALTAEVPADAPNPVYAAVDATRAANAAKAKSKERQATLLRVAPWVLAGLCIGGIVVLVGALLTWSRRRDRRAAWAAAMPPTPPPMPPPPPTGLPPTRPRSHV